MRAVSNAGPIIHLSWVDRLDLVKELFEEVLVPPAVGDEVLPGGSDLLGMPAIRAAFATDQLTVRAVTDRGAVARLESGLHRGEAEAIVLMQEVRAASNPFRRFQHSFPIRLEDLVVRFHRRAGNSR